MGRLTSRYPVACGVHTPTRLRRLVLAIYVPTSLWPCGFGMRSLPAPGPEDDEDRSPLVFTRLVPLRCLSIFPFSTSPPARMRLTNRLFSRLRPILVPTPVGSDIPVASSSHTAGPNLHIFTKSSEARSRESSGRKEREDTTYIYRVPDMV